MASESRNGQMVPDMRAFGAKTKQTGEEDLHMPMETSMMETGLQTKLTVRVPINMQMELATLESGLRISSMAKV